MKKHAIYLACALLALAAWLAAPVLADDGDEGLFTGEFYVGYRSVNVDGTESKYKEDINLDDGPRLFGLRFEYVPAKGMRSAVDRVELDITNFGGDPFETFRLNVRKYGRYNFSYRRTESDYFYEDIILPHDLADVRLSSGGDFHTFDFRRVRDVASFKYDFNRRAKLDVGFERFTKRGESTTTLDIQRDEFEFDKPIKESYDNLSVAFQYDWDKITLILEEQIRQYENDVEIFVPGATPGENTTNAAALDFFFLDQPYEYESNQHTVRIHARPNDKLIMRASASVQNLDLDVSAAETSAGTGFTGAPFTTDATGGGEIARDVEMFNFDISYMINDRFVVVGAVRRQTLDQQGDFLFDGALNEGSWDIETTGGEIGLQYQVSPQVTVGGGVRTESRDVKWGSAEAGEELELEDQTTDTTGFYANVGWHPTKRFKLDFEFEDSTYDDPFALTSATDRQRAQVKARWNHENGVFFDGSYVLRSYENNDSGWNADYDQLALRLGYQKQGLHASFGYSLIETDRSVDQLISFGTPLILFPVRYDSSADFIDCRIRWDANERWTLGGDARLYENDGTFPIERDDFRVFVEAKVTENYLARVGFRTIDYKEGLANFDDYDADILEVGVGYRW